MIDTSKERKQLEKIIATLEKKLKKHDDKINQKNTSYENKSDKWKESDKAVEVIEEIDEMENIRYYTQDVITDLKEALVDLEMVNGILKQS